MEVQILIDEEPLLINILDRVSIQCLNFKLL